ncbi:transglycosylase SLT domain-containing protein (plasmid) [Rothia amarae]|uniref:Transglycosylase SLT domain-containing protein n=1 Tax=Rothia amarae TaxID=169480 RepID=A0A7S7AZL2_9MICC|nr:transglycosylase SLT domain-containing protein [Rothia amarae]QOW64897.1 transglycosylase SLT domain-containing protein [Rothia amarae]
MGNATKTSTIIIGSTIALFLGVGTLWQPPQETPVACNDTTINAANNKTGNTINVPDEYKEPIKKAAQTAGLPESTVAAQIQAESQFDRMAGSPAGAQGPAQFLPSTFAKYSNGDIHNIEDSMEAYGKYMADLKKIVKPFAGDDPNKLIRLTLAAYNAGPGNVSQYKDVPPFPETKNYVEKITSGAQMKFTGGCKQVSGAKAWNGDLGKGEWTNPLPGGQFTSGFGRRNVPGLPAWAQMHAGVDLATGSGYGPQGTVIAPTDLKITGIYGKDGCVLGTMTAEPHFRMAFCHMDDYQVKAGDEIKKGTEMGRESNHAGSVGALVISHLHFEIHKPGDDYTDSNFNPYDGTAIDPEPILKEKGALGGR